MTRAAMLASVRRIRRHLHKALGYDPQGGHYAAIDEELDALERALRKEPKPNVKLHRLLQVGPVQIGGKSLLDMQLTHETSGLPLYPAFDTNWEHGNPVLAPEDGFVTRHSGSENSGYSVYMTGMSGLKYYFQHMEFSGRAPVGPVKKGAHIGVVGDAKKHPGARVDHNHVGLNAEKLLGAGKQLKYGKTGEGPNYTFGAPTIRKQLSL